MRSVRSLALLTLAALLASCTSQAATVGAACIAPANPGGGWDLTCRATAEALGVGAPGGRPMRVTNLPGTGGGVAFAQVVGSMRGAEQVIVAASPSTLLGLAQHHYGRLDEHSVRWVAAVGAEPSVVAVRADAPWRTLDDLVRTWKAHPESITIGGGSVVGGQDHMKMLLLARAAGVDVRRVKYLPLSGPREVLDSLHAGSVQVFPGDASEVQRQLPGRELRILAVLGERRVGGVLASVPTAREQGLDVIWVVWRGFYAPPGISDAAYRVWVERLHTMSSSPAWAALLARNGLAPFWMGGQQFERFVSEQTAAYRTVSQQIGIIP
jgi:putative tricarboxylic transport membrane protein